MDSGFFSQSILGDTCKKMSHYKLINTSFIPWNNGKMLFLLEVYKQFSIVNLAVREQLWLDELEDGLDRTFCPPLDQDLRIRS